MSPKRYKKSKSTFDGILIYLLTRKLTQNNEYMTLLQTILNILKNTKNTKYYAIFE